MKLCNDKKGTIQTVVLAVALVFVAAGVGLFIYFSKMPDGDKRARFEEKQKTIIESSKASEPEKTALRDNCVNLPDKIESCSPYKCFFFYEKAGQELINEVIGLVGDKCQYKEQTRNIGMNLACDFTSSTRQAVADFYTDLKLYNPENESGEPVAANAKVYKVGNKSAADPVWESLLNGECKIDK